MCAPRLTLRIRLPEPSPHPHHPRSPSTSLRIKALLFVLFATCASSPPRSSVRGCGPCRALRDGWLGCDSRPRHAAARQGVYLPRWGAWLRLEACRLSSFPHRFLWRPQLNQSVPAQTQSWQISGWARPCLAEHTSCCLPTREEEAHL